VLFSTWRQHYQKRVVEARTAIDNIKPGHRIVIGSACSMITVLSASGELVSCNTSQACASRCIQVPVWEAIWPLK